MRSHVNRLHRTLGFVAAAVLIAATQTFAAQIVDRGGKGAVPPNAKPYGKSYSEWSAAWWQWAYSLPVTGHPLFDETGGNAAAGQSGPVWFLGGVFNVSGSAHRTITIPTGTALFFPIIDVEWDNVCPPSDPPLTVDELAAFAAYFMDLATDLSCELDGVPIPNPSRFRVTAGPFSMTLPDDNIWQAFGCPNAVPGTYSPVMSDGFFIMLSPLAQGTHTLHFHGTIGPPVGFTLDIVYDITVASGASGASASMAPWPLSRMALSRLVATPGSGELQTPAAAEAQGLRTSFAPNPTNGEGTLRFTLSRPGRVVARLYDPLGRLARVITDGDAFSAGMHELRLDSRQGDPLTPGTYFYRITTPEGMTRGQISVLQ